MPKAETRCQLYAVLEAGESAPERLAAALTAADIASVLFTPAAGHVLDARSAGSLVEFTQDRGAAALIAGDARLARALRADGVHLAGVPDLKEAYRGAREILGQGRAIGIDPGISRHDAMSAAEDGADYIGFGAPAHLKDRDKAKTRRDELTDWWAEIFQVPCVAFDVETPEEAARLAERGADFVAVTLPVGKSAAATQALVAEIAAAIRDHQPAN